MRVIFVAMALLTVGLKLLLIACAAWITIRAFNASVTWGLFFLLAPALFLLLQPFTGRVGAVVMIGAVQLYYVCYHWRQVSRPFAAAVVLLAAIGFLTQGTFRGPLP